MTLASFLGLVTILIGPPCVAYALFVFPRIKRFALAFMVFVTCHIQKPFYMEVFFVPYRGVDRGFGVTVADLVFFGFFIYLLLGGARRQLTWWPYNTTLWLLLIAVSVISLTNSPVPYYGLFSIHKFIRGYILFWVMVNLVRERADIEAVIWGLTAAVLFQTGIVLIDKYLTHSVVSRSEGTFPHPNSLAMYVDLILPLLLSLLLADQFPKHRSDLAALAILGGILCVIFSKSRGSMVMIFCALTMVTALSMLAKPTNRKVALILAGFFVLDVMGAMAAPKIIERFQKAPEASELTRTYFNNAAKAMAADRLFGTGINSYSWMLENTDYYWQVYPDAADSEEDPDEFRESERGESRLGTAHHIYYLFAAETGWVGMIVFIMFIGRLYLCNLVSLIRAKNEYYQAMLLGLLAGFTTLHLQGLLEWVFRQTQVFYLFCALSGLMVAVGTAVKGEYRHG